MPHSAAPQRRTRIQLEVRETTLAAQLFFKNLGFRAISLLREFYEDSPEDAYLMQFRFKAGDNENNIDDLDQPSRLAG